MVAVVDSQLDRIRAFARQCSAYPPFPGARFAEAFGLRFPPIQQVSTAVQVGCARTPAVQRERLIRLYDDDFGRYLRDRRRTVRARSRRQTEVSVVRVFPAELLGAYCAQVVELFDKSQRVEGLHPGREVVV